MSKMYVNEYKLSGAVFTRSLIDDIVYFDNTKNKERLSEITLNKLGAEVHSVWNGKEIISVGDKTNKGVILSFNTSINIVDSFSANFENGGCYFVEALSVKLPKLTTTDGVEKFVGDKYFGVDLKKFSVTEREVKKSELYISKHFTSFHDSKKAYQYLAEQKAKITRGIETGVRLFQKSDPSISFTVDEISWSGHPDSFCVKSKSDLNRLIPSHFLTIRELAANEGLEVGMEFNRGLLKKWYEEIYGTKPFATYNDTITTGFHYYDDEPKFIFAGGSFHLPIIGFKAFKEKWEAKQKQAEIIQDGYESYQESICKKASCFNYFKAGFDYANSLNKEDGNSNN